MAIYQKWMRKCCFLKKRFTKKGVLRGLQFLFGILNELEKEKKMIVKRGVNWVVKSHDGKKTLGTYKTKEEAAKRLQQVEMFKHMKEKKNK